MRCVAFDVFADQAGQLRIGGMSRAVGYDTTLDTYTDQGQISDQVQQLVARGLVGEPQLYVVEVPFVDLYVFLVEQLRKTVELFVGDLVFNDYDSVVQIASFDQVVRDQRFQFVQEYERPAGSDLLSELVDRVEPCVLVANDLRIEIDVDVDREFVIRIDDDFNTPFGYGYDGFFVYFVVFAVGILFLEACCDDGSDVFPCGAIHDRGLRCVDIDQGIVYAATPQGCHDVFDRADPYAFLFDSSTSGGVGDVIRKGFYDRCSLQVDPSEFDPESRFGGIDRHRYIKSGVQTFPLKGYGSI